MTSTITVPAAHRQVFPGCPESIGQARAWVLSCLPAGCPRADDVALVVSELATNAVLHSASGATGGRYALQVELDRQSHSVGVTCIDLGPALVKAARPAGEGGRGLALVKDLVDVYEVRAEPTCRTVCCWLDWAEQAGSGR
ncbi:ATP-binding protein [Nonomuraea sp. NPDC049714]|uniref:ATP-binding protein n=1 Tax=Nonomuraea sp. NPDC049714 TaxID=3364357 RepID=UPI0037B14E47